MKRMKGRKVAPFLLKSFPVFPAMQRNQGVIDSGKPPTRIAGMIGKAGKAEQLDYTYLVFITRKCDFVFAKEMAPPPQVPSIMGSKSTGVLKNKQELPPASRPRNSFICRAKTGTFEGYRIILGSCLSPSWHVQFQAS